MDSGNSGSISSSGDEEYDSRADTVPPFLTQFGSISQSHPHSSLLSPHQNHHSLFDLSYLHALSQSNPNSNPNSLLNLDTASSLGRRSEPACCTDPANLPGASSSAANQSLLDPHSQAFDQCSTEPSLQLRSAQDDNTRGVSLSGPGNAVRNSKKRTRASRRAPTTVLTTDTSNFRAMVQEFTGIPAPPFSGTSSYSRRLDLLTGSSSLRSSSSHLDTAGAFYPLRPSPQKVQPSPLLLSSSTSSISSSSPSTLLHTNMVDAIASTTTTNNSSASIHYQLPPDLGLPYNQPQHMLSMQNHPILPFQSPPPPLPLHPMNNNLLAGFGAKSQGTLSIPLLEDLGMSHGGQVNAHLLSGVTHAPAPAHATTHAHVTSQGMPLRSDGGGSHGERGATEGRRDHLLRSFEGSFGKQVSGSCKLNFSASSNSSSSFNHDKTLDNTAGRGEGTVDSWICSSD